MTTKKMLILLGILLATIAFITACAGQPGEPGAVGPAGAAGPAGPAGPAGEPASAANLSCTECHNDTTLIASKVGQFEETSVHGTGESFIRGEEGSCAGCHGTEGSKARINAGLPPHDPSVEGVTNVSPFGCRTCHDIHTTYTRADFSLTGDAQPVKLEYSEGTFDGGAGNLCANCHQIRNPKPEVVDGNLEITSNRYGTHYGVEAQMLLGEGGLGDVAGTPSVHYLTVENTCVSCHMGEESNHTYLPDVERCQACHADAENFDINGVQTEVAAKLEELHTLFVDKGMLNPETDLWIASASAPLNVPEAVANAMWNYKFVTYDQSNGAHNSAYAKALLDAALETMNAYTP
jgi:hypothetical protein